MDEQQHNAIELPKGLYEPVLRQPMELDFLLGQELSLCFHDLDGSHVFKTCYGDICKAVNALRDYRHTQHPLRVLRGMTGARITGQCFCAVWFSFWYCRQLATGFLLLVRDS